MGRNDILESLGPSGEDEEGTHVPNYDLHAMDLKDSVLDLRMKFPDIKIFREAVKKYNVRRGKDINFFFFKKKKMKEENV
jgi:hypothetical protein